MYRGPSPRLTGERRKDICKAFGALYPPWSWGGNRIHGSTVELRTEQMHYEERLRQFLHDHHHLGTALASWPMLATLLHGMEWAADAGPTRIVLDDHNMDELTEAVVRRKIINAGVANPREGVSI